MSDLALPSGLNPLQVQIQAFLRGVGSVEAVVQTAWPGTRLDWFQGDIIRCVLLGSIGKYRELAVKGATGTGKGCGVSMAINLWFELPGSQVILNSESFAHCKSVLFAEVVSWRKRMHYGKPCEVLEASIRGEDPKSVIGIVNPEKGEGMSGRHGEHVLCCFDESTACSPQFYHLAQTQAHMIVAIANPRVVSGWFRRMFSHADPDIEAADILTPGGGLRRIITVSGESCWNVRTKTKVLPGQLTHEVLSEIMANPDANHRRIFGLGRFPVEDAELQLILPSWLPPHVAAWHDAQKKGVVIPVRAVGLDIADSKHGDYTVMAGGSEHGCREVFKRRKSDTMLTCGWCLSLAKQRWGIDLTDGSVPVVVDADGLGVGVADRLLEQGAWVVHHKGNQTAENPRNYGNYRAETYARLAERLNPDEYETPWPLPEIQTLLDDLSAPEKMVDSDGVRFKLQPKRLAAGARPPKNHRGEPVMSVQEKLGRSPDEGDAVAMLWRGVITLIGGEPVESQFARDDECLVYTTDMEKEVDDARKKEKPKKHGETLTEIAGQDQVQGYIDSLLGMADEALDDEEGEGYSPTQQIIDSFARQKPKKP